jgi:sigma-B regulation protein RsbU (phosphoserine phosphatase)
MNELPKGGPALGLMDAAPYAQHELTLQPGDYLILYSDGVTEARNEAGVFFGMQRLQALLPRLRDLPPSELGPKLLRALDRFSVNTRPSDDLSLVILRYQPVPAPTLPAASAAMPATAPAS